MGPATRAPVLLAVSTISPTETSSSLWSYAFRRILIFWLCIDILVTFLFNNRADDAGANGTATFADGEAKTFVHGYWGDQVNGYCNVITRHNHFGSGRKIYN